MEPCGAAGLLGVHPRTGELIVHTGTLRPPESFTYTIGGTSVPDFEWLYEVTLYAAWTGFGVGGRTREGPSRSRSSCRVG